MGPGYVHGADSWKRGLSDLFATYRDFGALAKVNYGWITVPMHRHKAVTQDGAVFGIRGHNSVISRLVDDEIVIIVLTNNALSRIIRMNFDLAAIMLGVRYRLPEPRTAIELAPEKIDGYVGKYEEMELTKEGDGLFLKMEDIGRFQIFPETSSRFFAKAADIEIKFTRTDLAGVTGMVVNLVGSVVVPDAEFRVFKDRPGG